MAQANYQLAVYDPNTGQLLDIVTQERWFDFQYTLAANSPLPLDTMARLAVNELPAAV